MRWLSFWVKWYPNMLCEVLTNNLFMVLSFNSYKLNLPTSGIRAEIGGLIGQVFIGGSYK